MNDAPLIRLTGMYENTAAKSGRRYFVGYLGGVKLLLLENTKAEPGEPGWNLCVTARPERQDAPRKPAPASQEREPTMAGPSPAPAPAAPQRRPPARPTATARRAAIVAAAAVTPVGADDGFDWDRGDDDLGF